MKIIQALKKIKQLSRKIETTKERISTWCSYQSDEEPLYTDIQGMKQSVFDMQAEIAKIRHAIHVLNATTKVNFKGKETTLDELLLEATVTIPSKLALLSSLRRKEKNRYIQNQADVKIILQYDPLERDKEVDKLIELTAEINDFIDVCNITLEL